MSPNDKAAKPAKPGKDPVEKLNEQVLKSKAFLDALHQQIAASLADPALAAKVGLRAALEGISDDVDRARETAGLVSAGLLRLKKEKWAPAKRGKNDFAPGSAVALRDHRLGRFDGAWEKADLKNLVVIGLYGRKAKCQIVRDGLKGECIGLVPAHWLQQRAA